MTIPDYQAIMFPLLLSLSDGAEHNIRDLITKLSETFKLSENEKKLLLKSGSQPIFDNRVHWARQYLKQAKLILAPRRSFVQITARGMKVIQEKPAKLDNEYLKKFPSFTDFINGKTNSNGSATEAIEIEIKHENKTPDETIDDSYQTLRETLTKELLEKVKAQSSYFFEKLVVDLLLAMGYGGSRTDAGRLTKCSNDEGIDGTIFEDRLGLDIIYIQAKKWDANIGRPEIQKFVGALQGQKARKGIFITTSNFCKSAVDYVSVIDSKVVLIDGLKLCEYMIDFNVGVQPFKKIEIKKIDYDYFENE